MKEMDDGILSELGMETTVSESNSDQLTFLAWIRVKKGEQTKNPQLRAIAEVCGDTAKRALANGNTKVFNDIGRKTTLSLFGHLGKLDNDTRKSVVKLIVDPTDTATLKAMLKVAEAKAKADKQ